MLEFFPPEDVINFTSLSEKALFWFEEDFPHKILSMGEADGLQEQVMQNMLLRELMSEGVINYWVPQLIDGKITTLEIVKHGPVCFMVTTTKAALHAENETRMISLEVDDSEDQTKRVLKKIAATVGRNIKPDVTEYHRWQDFQRLLRILGKRRGGWQVDVPFADDLSELIANKRAVRLRRDFSQILMAIKAHALLHLYKRETNSRGEIVADLDLDYGVIRALLDDIMAEASGVAVKKEVQETIDAVKITTAGKPNDYGATAYEVSKHLHLDRSSAWRRCKVAVEKGFVVNLEMRKGQGGALPGLRSRGRTRTAAPAASRDQGISRD